MKSEWKCGTQLVSVFRKQVVYVSPEEMMRLTGGI